MGQHTHMAATDADEVAARVQLHDANQLAKSIRMGIIAHPLLTACFYVLFPPALYVPLSVGTVTSFLIDVVLIVRRQDRTNGAAWACAFIAAFTTVLSAYAIANASRLGQDHVFWLLAAGTTCFQSGTLMANVWRGRSLAAAGTAMAIVPILGVQWSVPIAGWFLVHLSAISFFTHYRHASDRQQIALFASEARRIRAETELQEARFKADLELAVEIHSSISTPERFEAGPLKVTSGHRSFEPLGGDWIAARSLPDGRLVLLVVDVVGKGIQAALVVHAIQSLWVRAEAHATFDPGSWLVEVNRVLFDLGAGKPHNATAGLAVVAPHRVEYWGAGHLAMFVTETRGDVTTAVALPAGGPMLGIDPVASIRARTMELDPSASYAVLLGSDGVFESRIRAREIQRIAGEFSARGAPFLAELTSRDDRSLIMVERKAA